MAFSTFYHIVCVKYKPFETFIFKFCASIKESNAFGRERDVQGEGIMEMEEKKERERRSEEETEEELQGSLSSLPGLMIPGTYLKFSSFAVY